MAADSTDRTGPDHLTRRGFLAGGLSLGGAALLGGWPAGRGTDAARDVGSHPEGWYALVSDTHIDANRAAVTHSGSISGNLCRVVDDVLAAPEAPRAVIYNGDLARKAGQPGDYAQFRRLTAPLDDANIPHHIVVGNHDDRAHLVEAFGEGSDPSLPGLRVGSIEAPGLRWLLLDSQQGVNVTHGALGAEQRDWVAAQLDAQPDIPTVLLVHHHPNSLNENALRDADELLAVLRPRRNAKAIIYGHTHVWHPRKLGDIHAINLPAVGYRFLGDQPLGYVAFRPRPGGAEIELRCIGGERKQHARRIALRWRPDRPRPGHGRTIA